MVSTSYLYGQQNMEASQRTRRAHVRFPSMGLLSCLPLPCKAMLDW